MAPTGISLNSAYAYLTAYDPTPTSSVSSYAPTQPVIFVGGQPIQVPLDGDDIRPREHGYDPQQIVIETSSPEASAVADSRAEPDAQLCAGMRDFSPPETMELELWQIRKELRDMQALMMLGLVLFVVVMLLKR